MMMKRFLTLALAAVLLLCACTPASAAADTFTREEAWTRAFALVEAATDYTRDQLDKAQMAFEDGVWYFSLTLKDPAEDEDGLIVGDMDDAGNLIGLTGPEKIGLEQQLERELKACWHRDDSPLLLADVTAEWAPKLAALSEAELGKIWPQYVGVVKLGITLPPENMLTREEARLAAMKHLVEAEGWTEDMPDLFVLWVSAYYVLDGTPVWFFGLEPHSWMEPAYSTDAAMNRYDRELEAAFGAVDRKVPRNIGVLVNALTGELYEKPMLDYAPVEFNYLDFLVRTDEAVASVAE